MAQTVEISGNTYPVKDQLKALGGRWDSEARVWRVPAHKAGEARALVSAAPKSFPKSYRSGSMSKRRACRTGGNCSSFGSGRSCGGHDCDGW